ncbi:hypothetical protein ACFP1Z_17000 [Streptomyces gamaensis]|uniref:Uncharacterized protein n=1 Tax=Streptomyces gamaensis TaxID=1763542 RepID=A0ABW0Z1Q6_9ACTN
MGRGAGQNGNWWLSLPVRPARCFPGTFRARIGPGDGVYCHSGCHLQALFEDTGVAPAWVDADYPAVPANGQRYEVWGTYEAAS